MTSAISSSAFALLRSIVTKVSIYSSILPHNLNWTIHNCAPLHGFLKENPLGVVDIGARDGSLDELQSLRPYISYVGFDADPIEADRLNARSDHGFKSFRVEPLFVGPTNGPQQFNLFNRPGESSQLFPNPDYARAFANGFEIREQIEVEGISLDNYLANNPDVEVDVLKLDTQGTEFDILSSGKSAIGKALLIESEVEFMEMYQNQKLFHDICSLLYRHDFVLLYLNRVFVNRKQYQGNARGQIVFGDALFGLSERAAENLPLEKQAKYCVLLINYGLVDFAYDLFVKNRELQMALPGLRYYFKKYSYGTGILSKMKRAAIMQMEKLVAIFLYARKTNQIRCDSDRSWPIR